MGTRHLRIRRVSDDEDDFNFVIPKLPSELRQMPDDELMRNYRKAAIANLHPFSAMLEHELQARLITALDSFRAAADRSARTLNVLTFVLVVLTVVLVVYTIRAG
jgi:hypothetical protein